MDKLTDNLIKLEFIIVLWDFFIVGFSHLALKVSEGKSNIVKDLINSHPVIVILIIFIVSFFLACGFGKLLSKLLSKLIFKFSDFLFDKISDFFDCLSEEEQKVVDVFIVLMSYVIMILMLKKSPLFDKKFGVKEFVLTTQIAIPIFQSMMNRGAIFKISLVEKSEFVSEISSENTKAAKVSSESFYFWCTNTGRAAGNIKFVGWCYEKDVNKKATPMTFCNIKRDNIRIKSKKSNYDFLNLNVGEMSTRFEFNRTTSEGIINGIIYLVFVDSINEVYSKKISLLDLSSSGTNAEI